MLRFFRVNDPYRLLFIFLFVVLLGMKAEWDFEGITLPEFKGVLVGEALSEGKQLYVSVWDSLPPLPAWFQKHFHSVSERSTLPRHIASWAFIFFQAAFFGIMLIRNRAMNESTYLPAFIFLLLCFFSFDTIAFTREILGSTLLLLAMRNLLKEVEFSSHSDENILNLGLFLGLSTLCSMSYLVFVVGTVALLFLYSRPTGRRFGLLLIGLAMPHVATLLFYWWNDALPFLWQNFYRPNLEFNSLPLVTFKTLLALCVVPALFFLFALVMTSREARLTKYQSQILQLMFFWFVFALVEVGFTRFRTPQALLVCAPPVAYFISHYLLLIRRKWIAESMLWIFVVLLVILPSLAAREKFGWINYSALKLAAPAARQIDKRIMILADALPEYQAGKPAGPFLEWPLAEDFFSRPADYGNILYAASIFKTDAPAVILDPNNLMKKYFDYLPEVKHRYMKTASGYELKPAFGNVSVEKQAK